MNVHAAPAAIRTAIDRIPRISLAAIPTPLQHMRELSAALGGPRIYVKRDDLTGLALGGNKVRQLEFFLGDARAQRADVLVAGGGSLRSNHARVCAAAARACGMRPVIVVRPDADGAGGNALLTRLLCDDIRAIDALRDASENRSEQLSTRRIVFEQIAEDLRQQGEHPYVLLGTSLPLGTLGYAHAALELHDQLVDLDIRPDSVVVASSGSTQAGLEIGSRLIGEPYRVVGVAPRPTAGRAGQWVSRLASDGARLLGFDLTIGPGSILNEDGFSGSEPELVERRSSAVRLLAETEGLLLDPLYNATAMAALVAWIRSGRFTRSHTVVFVHTGGLPLLFAEDAESLFSGG